MNELQVQPPPERDPPPAFNPHPITKAKTTVTESIYHQLPDRQPEQVWHTWDRDCESDDQQLDRLLHGKRAVGEAWVKINTEWIEDAGHMWILNMGGEPLNAIPTQAQIAEEAARVLLVGVEDDAGQVVATDELHPGQSVRRLPPDSRRMRLRCRCGSTRVRVVSHPR